MKRIIPILVVGILVLSGLGTATGTNNKTIMDKISYGDNELDQYQTNVEDDRNQPPTVPIIDGPTYGKAGVAYNYTFVSTDPEGHDLYYTVHWGDGTFEDLIGPYASGVEVTIKHTFYEQGTYNISAQAMSGGGRSGWATLTVTMPRNKILTNSLFLRFLERFPILERLLILLK